MDRQPVVAGERGHAPAAHIVELLLPVPRELDAPFDLTSVDGSLEQVEAQLAPAACIEREVRGSIDVQLEVPASSTSTMRQWRSRFDTAP